MSKQRSSYVCNNCGAVIGKWVGRCNECAQWNTYVEQAATTSFSQQQKKIATAQLTTLATVTSEPKKRMVSGIKEWDRVTGGGIVPGSFLVVTGDPGIGKSTLMLLVAHHLAAHHRVLYFSSEESLEQVKDRAARTNCLANPLLFSDQAHLDTIIATAQQEKPDLVIIDSLQNCYGTDATLTPGGIGHLKESAFRLMRLAKEESIAIVALGHITKEGIIAGPKTLEHMVDAVLYLQAEDRWHTRVLRTVKNRFGTINELGFFQMGEAGLEEVSNINQQLLASTNNSPGSVLISYLEGSRPLLVELQALTIGSKFTMPQRIISGVDATQVALIASILEKYIHIKFSAQDIFFKVSGGFKIKSSAADLGIALALLSSYFQHPLAAKSIALGELSLTGHVQGINHIGLHLKEAEKFGITAATVSGKQKIDEFQGTLNRFFHVRDLLILFDTNRQ